jgi:hypothetical protein
MSNLARRLDALEAARPARDGPIVVRLRSAPGLAFTRRGLADWVRETPPWNAHPIRQALASTWLSTLSESDADDREQAHEAAEQAVRDVDEAIVRGEIVWLADAIAEWDSRPPSGMSGTTLSR